MKILSDIMDLLFEAPFGSTIRDINEVMLTVLRTVIQTTIAMDRESSLVVSQLTIFSFSKIALRLVVKTTLFYKVNVALNPHFLSIPYYLPQKQR